MRSSITIVGASLAGIRAAVDTRLDEARDRALQAPLPEVADIALGAASWMECVR